MATRVNVRFISVLVVTVLAVGLLLGGLWFLQVKGDATRNIKAGDEYVALAEQYEADGKRELAQQHYERAVRTYGRAVHKEPANLEFLDRMERALLELRPQTRDLAAEFDNMRLAILATRARYRPRDADAHLALLEELLQIARFGQGSAQRWGVLSDSADDMWQRVPPEDPKRIYARLYRGLADTRVLNPRVDSEQDIEAAQQDLLQFLTVVPESDLGWASLAASQLSLAHYLDLDVKTRRAQEAYRALDATLAQAREAVPDGPEVARVETLRLVTAARRAPASVDPAAVAAAVDHMVDMVGATADPLLLSECVAILRSTDLPGRFARAVQLMENFLADNPDQHYHRALLAELHYLDGDFEAAEAAAEAVIAAEPVRVSRLSRYQHVLKVRTQSLNVDIEYRRWEDVESTQKEAQLARVEAATARLASMVVDPATDLQFIRAEGKVAFARRDFPTATSKFEEVLKGGADFETAWYAAHALEQVGQLGLALERFEQAGTLVSSHQVQTAIGRLQAKLGRYDQAHETLQAVLQVNPESSAAQQLKVFVEMRRDGATDAAIQDETARAIAAAQEAFEAGDSDTARAQLLSVLERSPDNISVLTRLMGVEVREGRMDEARSYLNRALSAQPNNRYLRGIQASIDNEDPVEALKLYLSELYDDEGDRAVYTAVQLRAMARGLEQQAQRHEAAGALDDAAEARVRAERATAEFDAVLAAAEQLAPDHAALLEFRFTEALAVEDWDRCAELAARAQKVDADQAGGLLFKGRLELARGQLEEAVRTLTDATVRKHFSSLAWRLLGRSHERIGNFADALQNYEEAYDCNPNDRFAVRWYVGLLSQLGEKVRALRVLQTARQVIPDDAMLRDQWLQLEADVGDVNLALRERRATYEATPGDQLNAMRLVALLSLVKPVRELVLNDQGNPKYDLDQWNLRNLEERQKMLDEVAAAWAQEADGIVAGLQAAGIDNQALASLRADVLRTRDDVAGGEQILRSYADSRTGAAAVQAFTVLAVYQANTGRLGAAVTTLEGARPLQDEIRAIDRALAALYYTNGRWSEALEIYRSLAEDDPARALRMAQAECQVKLGQFDEAAALVQAVVAADGADFSTEMISAQLAHGQAENLLAQGRADDAKRRETEARAALDRARRLQPTNTAPHVRRAQWLLAEFRRTGQISILDDALLALDRGDEAQANSDAIALVRFSVLRAKGNQRGASGELMRLLERVPGHTQARQRLVELYLENQDLKSAVAVIDEAIANEPRAALWHERKADLHMMERDIRSAVSSYRRANDFEPTPGRLTKFANACLALEKPDFITVINILVPDEKSLEGRPVLRTLYARALTGVERAEESHEQMRIAYHEHHERWERGEGSLDERRTWFRILSVILFGQGPEAVEQFARETAGAQLDARELAWLAELWVNAGGLQGLPRALQLQQQAIERCPADEPDLRAELVLAVGQFELAAGDTRGALETFEDVIAIDPDNSAALNNAAYLWAEELNDPAKALPLAERALKLQQGNPDVLDTVGWIQFKLQNYGAAEEQLRRSFQTRPAATTAFHLAAVLNAQGRYEAAETYLLRAAELNDPDRNPRLQEEIDRLSNEISPKIKE